MDAREVEGRHRSTKLEELAQEWGYSEPEEMLEHYCIDSVVPGICCEPECRYSTEVEPDCRDGYCEMCGGQTVQSCLVIAGVI